MDAALQQPLQDPAGAMEVERNTIQARMTVLPKEIVIRTSLLSRADEEYCIMRELMGVHHDDEKVSNLIRGNRVVEFILETSRASGDTKNAQDSSMLSKMISINCRNNSRSLSILSRWDSCPTVPTYMTRTKSTLKMSSLASTDEANLSRGAQP